MAQQFSTQNPHCDGMCFVSRTNIDIDNELIHKAAKLTRLKTKRQIVHRALDSLVKAEERKKILRYYGAGIWKGDSTALRKNRA